MRKLAVVLVAFVAGCGAGSTHVSTVSASPNPGSDGGVGTPTPGGGGAPTPGGSGGAGGSGGGGTGGGGVACPMIPTAVTQPPTAVAALAVDDSSIYFVAGGAVYRAAKAGGDPVWLAGLPNGAHDYSWSIAVDDSSVYFNDSGAEDGSTSGNVMLVSKGGGTARVLVAAVAEPCGAAQPTGLAIDGTTVYYTQTVSLPQPPPSGCSGTAHLMSVPKAGGTPTMLATRTDLYRLAIDATNAYMIAETNQVVTIPKVGGTLVQLESSLGGDWKSGLAVDGTYVYVGDQHGHLAAVRKADGATTLYGVGAHDSAALSPVADQMGHVYWDESGTLDVINADGSGLRTTTPITVDGAVALDDTSVYVSSFDGSNHHIYRLCK